MLRVLVLVVWNIIRFSIKQMRKPNLTIERPQLIGWNSRIICHSTAKVFLGKKLFTDGRFVLIADNSSDLRIGQDVYFNEEAMISCKGSITIGSGCKFGPNVKIFDNNHCFDRENGVSNDHSNGKIVIGENCWIGTNVVILKGANIGSNCVIGAGCIVDSNVPEGSIVQQNRDLVITPMEKR